MAFVFPTNPTVGQKYTEFGKTWEWDGEAWRGSTLTLINASTLGGLTASQFLRSDTSDTMTGSLTITGNVTIADRIIHSGDTNTQIRFPANDTVSVETNGAERMRIDNNGNVLIGTPSTLNKNATAFNLQTSGMAAGGSVFTYGVYGGSSGNLTLTANAYPANTGSNHFVSIASGTAGGGGPSEIARFVNNGRVGIATTSPTTTLDVGGTAAIKVPVGTTAQRPTPATGQLRFNSQAASFEGYNGSAWGSIGGGASGGGGDQVFYENDQTVTANYTIPADKNAMTTGPININSGVVITVSTGARWVII
jgi:hypothetical protein